MKSSRDRAVARAEGVAEISGGQIDRGVRAGWIVLVVVLVCVAAIRIHRFDLPLERDEGEYGYGARLILEGEFSYEALRTMKWPGVHLALTPFLVSFGDTPEALRVALLCFDVGSAIAMFVLARGFLGAWRAGLVAGVLALLQTSVSVLGLFAHAENFALLPVLLGLVFAVRAARGGGPSSWFWSGMWLGVAVLMKQQAITFGVLALLGVLYAARGEGARSGARRGGLFLAGAALPIVALCAWMGASGGYEAFWFSTVTYARAYTSGATWSQGLKHLQLQFEQVSRFQAAFAVLGVVGVVGLCGRRALRSIVGPWTGLALAGLIAASVGLYFRAHYFVLVLPAVAVAVVCGAETLAEWVVRVHAAARRRVVAALLLAAGVLGLVFEREVVWTADPRVVSRQLYYPNPFAEGAEIAELIRSHSIAGDTIAVLGSEPQIAFLAGRRSATGFVYMYPLLEEHEHAAWMQERAIAEIEALKPRIFVSVNVPISWLRRRNSVTRILEWMPEYARRHYKVVGMLDLDSQAGGKWFDAEALARVTRAPTYSVLVLERIAGS